jgi:hypothetical protein
MEGLLDWLAHHAGTPPHLFQALRPDFFVVAPPKTGSTWLAHNLRPHPDIFIPGAKEVKYFSSLGRWLGVDWYLSQFSAGAGRLRGDVSPSYASLPPERIRLIRTLFPEAKVVFLLREPAARAWSHTRHCCRHGEGPFLGRPAGTNLDAPHIDWEGGAAHEYVTMSGDYLGQLRRWLGVFPKEQVLVRFYEDISTRPEALLREVLAFLGADSSIPLAGFPLRERINPGVEQPIPSHVAQLLHRLWHGRTAELAALLRRHFGLTPPQAWGATLAPPTEGALSSPVFAEAFERKLGDMLALEEVYPIIEYEVCPDLDGFRVVLRERRLLAEGHGTVIEAASMVELKALIAEHKAQRQRAEHEARLGELWQRIGTLERGLYEAGQSVQHLEEQVARLRPWYRGVGRWLVGAWERLRAAVSL